MTYYDKDYLLGSPPGFDGTFTELDGELVYIVPSGKQGTVNVSIQYREDGGTALVDENGNSLPSFVDSISVAGGASSDWQDLSALSSTGDLGGAKYRMPAPTSETPVTAYTLASNNAAVSVSNATFDFGLWPYDIDGTPNWVAVSGSSGQFESSGFDLTHFTSQSSLLSQTPVAPLVYDNEEYYDIVRRDFKLDYDGFTYDVNNVRHGLTAAVDYNFTTLFDVSGARAGSTGTVNEGVRGQMLFAGTVGTAPTGQWDYLNDSYAARASDSEDPKRFYCGLEVTDAGMITAMDNAVQEVIGSAPNAVHDLSASGQDLVVIAWSANNVDSNDYIGSYDASTPGIRRILLRDINAQWTTNNTDNYFAFTFGGAKEFMAAPDNPAAFPVSGTSGMSSNSSDASVRVFIPNSRAAEDIRIYGYKKGIGLSVTGTGSLTLSGATIKGAFDTGIDVTGVDASASLSVASSIFDSNGSGLNATASEGAITVQGNSFDYSTGRHMELVGAGDSGFTVRRNTFGLNQKLSQMIIQQQANNLIEENLFSSIQNSHGNACTLYKGSFTGTTVKNNIFINCSRCMSIQAKTPSTGDAAWFQTLADMSDGLTVSNNLSYVDNDFDQQYPSQPGFAWIGNSLTGLATGTYDAEHVFQYNSMLVEPSGLTPENQALLYKFGTIYLGDGDNDYSSALLSRNNLLPYGMVQYPDEVTNGPTTSTARFSTDNYAGAAGSTAIGMTALDADKTETPYWVQSSGTDSIAGQNGSDVSGVRWTKTGTADPVTVDMITSATTADQFFSLVDVNEPAAPVDYSPSGAAISFDSAGDAIDERAGSAGGENTYSGTLGSWSANDWWTLSGTGTGVFENASVKVRTGSIRLDCTVNPVSDQTAFVQSISGTTLQIGSDTYALSSVTAAGGSSQIIRFSASTPDWTVAEMEDGGTKGYTSSTSVSIAIETAAPSSDIFDVDFTAMTSSTDVYIDDSTTADIDGITFGNYVEAGTVWKVGSGSSSPPYNTEVHLYKHTAATGNDFSAAMAGDISTLPTAWTMEGVVAEGANASNSDYGWLVACNSDGTAQVRAVINSNTGNLRIRTLISGSWTYQSTVSLSQAIDSDDQQFLRASYDGTTLTVTAWDGTDDTGTQLATASTTTLPTLSTYFGFLAATGSTSSTRSRSVFSMKLTDDS